MDFDNFQAIVSRSAKERFPKSHIPIFPTSPYSFIAKSPIKKTPEMADRQIPLRKEFLNEIDWTNSLLDRKNGLGDQSKSEFQNHDYDQLLQLCMKQQTNFNQPLSANKFESKKLLCFSNERQAKVSYKISLKLKQNETIDQLSKAIVPLEEVSPFLRSNNNEQFKRTQLPEKVLDAPGLVDDFQVNVLDWSYQNVLAVGLGSSVFLWNQKSQVIEEIPVFKNNVANDQVTSLAWSDDGNTIAIGTQQGKTQLVDQIKKKQTQKQSQHSKRIGCLSWKHTMENILSSCSKDKTIVHQDKRVKKSFSSFLAHNEEICGLKWSYGEQLATGGNDNKVKIWNLKSKDPELVLSNAHTAAVKALSWNVNNSFMLATGGGTADRTIKIWNTLSNKQLKSVTTDSQVCNLLFSKNTEELISCHGQSNNEIAIWSFSSTLMKKFVCPKAHRSRVLQLCLSPTGESIATGAGDQNIKIWNFFPKERGSNSEQLLTETKLR